MYNTLTSVGTRIFKEEREVDVLKAVALCAGGVPQWRHLIQFLPGEYHDRRVKTPLWTNLATRFTDSY